MQIHWNQRKPTNMAAVMSCENALLVAVAVVVAFCAEVRGALKNLLRPRESYRGLNQPYPAALAIEAQGVMGRGRDVTQISTTWSFFSLL